MSIQAVGNQVDISRAKAEKFVNASDNTINRLARRNYNKLYSEEDKKFDKRLSTTLKTLPFVAVASGLAMGKGKKGALLSGLSWGMALVAPSLVAGANKAFVKSPKVAEAERKHPIATLTASIAASVGAFVGLTSIADKVLSNPRLMNKGKKMVAPVVDAVEKFADKAVCPKFVRDGVAKLGNAKTAIINKIPASVKDGAKALVESPVAKSVGGFVKNLGKGLVKNAPTLVVLGTVGALIGKGMADARKYSGIKADLKDAQFNTAKNLVNAYSAENKELKAENAKLASAAVEAEAEE